MKNKIIVPVDFSNNAHNAYLFALSIATTFELDLVVVHIYNESYSITRTEELMKKLDQFVGHIPKEDSDIMAKTRVITRVIQGEAIKEIINLSQQGFMIVMGKRGIHEVSERVFGSVSSAVAQNARCPILLVPKGSKFDGFNHILFASNLESSTEKMLDNIKEFAAKFKASLHFIHVKEFGKEEDFIETEDRIFEDLFKNKEPDFSFNLASISSKSVQKGLEQYAKENDIDLIALVNFQRSFWHNLFGQSLTKKMALNTNFPILVYHFRN